MTTGRINQVVHFWLDTAIRTHSIEFLVRVEQDIRGGMHFFASLFFCYSPDLCQGSGASLAETSRIASLIHL